VSEPLPLANVHLLIEAKKAEGVCPVYLISHSGYWGMSPEARAERDWVVLQDDTWAAWLEAHPPFPTGR
jgi:hypothetical protein